MFYIYLKGTDLGIVTAKGKVKIVSGIVTMKGKVMTAIGIATMKVVKKIGIRESGIVTAIGTGIVNAIVIEKLAAIVKEKTMNVTGIETLVLVEVILEATRVGVDREVMIMIVEENAVHRVVLIDVIGFVIAIEAAGREAVAMKLAGMNVAAENVNIVKEML